MSHVLAEAVTQGRMPIFEFELKGETGGTKWVKVYADGRVEGVATGILINRARHTLDYLEALALAGKP